MCYLAVKYLSQLILDSLLSIAAYFEHRREKCEALQFVHSGVLKQNKLFGAMMRGSNVYDPHILQAIRRIRGIFPHSYPISVEAAS
jgi:hypothetical protein